MRATDAQGWTWFKLLSYCHQQMNEGKIADCADWPENFWLNIGVKKAVILEDSPLWHFSGLILHVHFYDKAREAGYKEQIAGGKKGAKSRWKKRVKNGLPIGLPIGLPNGQPDAKEGKKERILSDSQSFNT